MKKIWILLCSMVFLTGCGIKKIENAENFDAVQTVPSDTAHTETTKAPSDSHVTTAQQTTTVSTSTTAMRTDAVIEAIQAPETVPVEERLNGEKYRYVSGRDFAGDYVTDENGDAEPVYGNAILTIGDGNYLISFPTEDDTRIKIRLCNLQVGELASMTVDAQPTLTHTGFWTLKAADAGEQAMRYDGRDYSKILFYRYNFQLESSFDISPLGTVDHLFCDESNRVLYGFSETEDGFTLRKLDFFAAEAETVLEKKRAELPIYGIRSLHYTSWGFLFTGLAEDANGLPKAAYGVMTPDENVEIRGIHDTLECYQMAPFWEGAYIYGEQCETGKVLRFYGGAEQTITLSQIPTTQVFSASPSGAYLIAGDVVLEQKEKLRDPRRKSTLYQYWEKYYWLLAYDSTGTLIGKTASIGTSFESLAVAEASRDLEGLRFGFFYDEQRAELFYAVDQKTSVTETHIGGMMECMDMRTIDELPFGEKESEDET